MEPNDVLATIRAWYGECDLFDYLEGDQHLEFQVPRALVDPQYETFRSRAPALNDLAISHRLSLLVGRGSSAVPNDAAFAISSIQTSSQSIDAVGTCRIGLRVEAVARRRDAVTAIRSVLTIQHGAKSRVTITCFDVLPASLVGFIRRGRDFTDFADIQMSRQEPALIRLTDRHLRYFPSEGDRLSDGRRVDHVPALALVDIALQLTTPAGKEAEHAEVSAKFKAYADPRLPFDILLKEDPVLAEFVQNDQLIASIQQRERSA